IGLTFMGLADQIVMMAFGLILGSAAVATAIAFGLGGRDFAARMLDQWQMSQMPPPPPIPPRLKRVTPADDDSQPPLV
ncbi:MAG: mechanosensitive ion channel, partial [Sphingomicrobium sp.]